MVESPNTLIMERDYQALMSDAVIEQWKTVQSTCVISPTGTGKTHVAALILHKAQPRRAIFLCHLDLIAFQTKKAIEAVTGFQCAIDMAELKADYSVFSKDRVVIATVQSQNAGPQLFKRMLNFRPNDFDVVICDEAHHFPAPSFRKVIEHFKQNPRIKIVGFTATPVRLDKLTVLEVFERIAYKYDIQDAIDDGWLVPIDQMFVPVDGLDYSHVHTTGGDLNPQELADVMEEEKNIQKMVQPTLEYANSLPLHKLDYHMVETWGDVIGRQGVPRRTIVFCASVAQARRFAEVINRVTPDKAVAIWDKIPRGLRKDIFARFADGRTQILVNVGICSEGFDNPGIELLVMARGTKSIARYTQWSGRVLRPLPGIVDGLATAEERRNAIAASAKKSAIIMDFVGNCGRHKLITSLDLLGGRMTDKAKEVAYKKLLKREKPARVDELLDASEDQVKKAIERAQLIAAEKRKNLVARVKYSTISIDPFDAFNIVPISANGMDSKKRLSAAQMQLLRRSGIEPNNYGYKQAMQLFVETLKRWKNRLATIGQIDLLGKHGYDARNMNHKQASNLINMLRNNGWQRPASKIDPDV